MFKALEAYASLIKMALIVGAVLIVYVFYEGVPFLVDGRVDTQRKEAAAEEGLIWTTKMAELRAAGEKQRIEDQAKIDLAEAQYWAERKQRSLAQGNLANAAKNSPTKDRPAISRDLVRELNKIGGQL